MEVDQDSNRAAFGFLVLALPPALAHARRPANIRRASLRGQIHTELSPEELAKGAQEQGISVEQLKKDQDSVTTSILRSFSSMKAAN